MTCDYVAPTLTTGAGFAKTSSQVTGQFTAVTGRLAAGDIYKMTFTFSASDGTNPLASAVILVPEFHLTNVTGVAAVGVAAGVFRYEAAR